MQSGQEAKWTAGQKEALIRLLHLLESSSSHTCNCKDLHRQVTTHSGNQVATAWANIWQTAVAEEGVSQVEEPNITHSLELILPFISSSVMMREFLDE